ncbi:MAG: hypothetical protein DMG49_11640 [Acidobacteria bacterium]|nr:MAG: hypothetical protein DMG49_11640 [Acidobacteriota bacterium]
MGAVYRAQDLRLGREAALKFLPTGMAVDRQASERLLKEAQAASRLNHPSIATIYEVNESEELPFIAMELVNGESLKQILQRGALAPQQLLDIARQIAEGLHEAHRAGVYHRDIKPANIMLDSKARVKILDFGLATLAGRERAIGETEETFVTRASTQNTTGGTVPYMSPEQLRGEPTDASSDIFSRGNLYRHSSFHSARAAYPLARFAAGPISGVGAARRPLPGEIRRPALRLDGRSPRRSPPRCLSRSAPGKISRRTLFRKSQRGQRGRILSRRHDRGHRHRALENQGTSPLPALHHARLSGQTTGGHANRPATRRRLRPRR